MNGWDIDTLQSAVDQCTNPSGRVEDCPIFSSSLQSEDEQGTCKIENKLKALANDDCDGPSKGLCGNVPIQYGPGYASALKGGDKSGEKTVVPLISSVAVPTQSYAPARSQGAGGISIYAAKPSADAVYVAAAPAAASSSHSSSSSSSYKAPVAYSAAPAVTPKPAAETPVDGNIISTSTYTKDGVVYLVAIKEVIVYVTVSEDAAGYKARRHAHAHAHRRDSEHGLLGRS